MSLKQYLDVHINLHLDSLTTLRNLPSGLPGQCAELSAILGAYEADIATIKNDSHLSPTGQAAKLREAHDVTHAAIEGWKISRTTGIEAQAAAQWAKCQAQADRLLPAPSTLQVQNMVQRLSAFDPVEVEMLYSDATDAERRVIEAAASAIGRQPRRRGEQIVWEPLISTERTTAAITARVQRVDPDGAAGLRDARRICNTYEALAGAATGLLRDSILRTPVGDSADILAPAV